MANYYSGRDARVVHITQTTFGTDEAMSTAGAIKGTSAFDIEHDLNVREADMVTGQRWRVQADTRTDQNEAMPTIGEDGVVFKANLSDQLYQHFQNVEDVTGGDEPKIFSYHATQPDFVASAGYFEQLVLQNIDADSDVGFKDCVAQEITFSVEPRGELQFSTTHNSRGSGSANLEYTGTATRVSTGSYHFTSISEKSVNGVAFNPIGPIEITCSQVVQPIGIDSTGNGKFETFLLSDKSATFKAKINFDQAARNLKHNFVNDQPVNILFGWGTASTSPSVEVGSADGDLHFSGSAKVTSWKEDLSEAYGIDVEFAFYGLQTAGADGRTTSPLEVRMADGIVKGY